MDARLVSPGVPQPKAPRGHDPPHRTALGLCSHGFIMGLGRDRLAWSLGLSLLWRQYEAAAQEIQACAPKVE
jgi:hypothetical protein